MFVADVVAVVPICFVFLTIRLIYSWMVCPIVHAFLKIHTGDVSVLYIYKEVFVLSEDIFTIKYHKLEEIECPFRPEGDESVEGFVV